MDKQNELSAYNGKSFTQKKKTSDPCYDLDETSEQQTRCSKMKNKYCTTALMQSPSCGHIYKEDRTVVARDGGEEEDPSSACVSEHRSCILVNGKHLLYLSYFQEERNELLQASIT